MEKTGTSINKLKTINLLLLPGLIGIILSLLRSQMGMTWAIVIIPFLLILLVQTIKEPITLFFFIFTLNYFVMGISRYVDISGISFLMDTLMASTLVLIFIHTALLRNIEWSYAINILTIGCFIWMLYCLAEIYNPSGVVKAWVLSRGLAINGIVIALIVALLFNKYKYVKHILFTLAIFTLLACAKAFMQRSLGFDYAEARWLNNGGYLTHLIHSGTRYFSFFTDASNFGSNMGCAGVIFFITACYFKNSFLKCFYFIVSLLSIYAMFLSGTRGAMVVPLAGLALFAIVSKNYKILTISGFALLVIYVFFAFTTIGEGNQQIRRMRTAFRPTEDASFNVRKENQKILAAHLKDKPFGEGLGLSGGENKDISIRLTTMIPNDSWYVKIWVETGIIGLILYLAIHFLVIVKGCWILMFKVKNKELKGVLSGFLCGIFGMFISAYGNPFWGQFPTAIIAYTGLALVLKGEYFDKEIERLKEKNKTYGTISLNGK
ncbi:O-antigen ligase family protein [Parabacteroides sp. PF5-6]|uniref:O-antigen ligase family protein n=1 Tax=Parabacteroides sp. PF5-6 TaxID=1742403 RepID=UPI00240754DC|nr:O-antigen ligase family protein [Parabacteroides sp. PF5-6]MDF9831738.1 hypothetical protein [Parabacteroides sp. PF5-6]